MLPVDADGTQVKNAGCTHHHVQHHKYIAVQTAKVPRATNYLQKWSKSFHGLDPGLTNTAFFQIIQNSKMNTLLSIWTNLILSDNLRQIRSKKNKQILQTVLIFYIPKWNTVVMDGWVISNKPLEEMLQLWITKLCFHQLKCFSQSQIVLFLWHALMNWEI